MCTRRRTSREDPSVETSDSSNLLLLLPNAANKRPRINEPEAVQNASKYKGVVLQQNGHWGAQIYANHHRFWLGTFKSETEAAMAYDSAAIKLRSSDSHRNFPWTVHTVQEHRFQTQFSSEAILSMIRDGSYQPKFQDFLMLQNEKGNAAPYINPNRVHIDGKDTFVQLFEKELTPSDVGKLNRLVVPKKFAVKYLPFVPEDGAGVGVEDTELVLYDSKLMKSWSFRYSYWKSSQSYVFTRGWNRFVKEKNLKERDVVMFYRCMSHLEHKLGVDIRYADDRSSEYPNTKSYSGQQDETFVRLELGQKVRTIDNHDHVRKDKRVRLFGVWIENENLVQN